METLSPGVSPESLGLLLRFANHLRASPDETIKTLSSAMSTRYVARNFHFYTTQDLFRNTTASLSSDDLLFTP